MTIIEGASGAVKTLADGTLRIAIDIEPRHAQAAFALFGSPGTAVAIAALKTLAQQEQPQEPVREKPKGGELSKWIALRCQEPPFHDWLQRHFPAQWRQAAGDTPTEKAAGTVRAVCSVESRAEIDNDERAQKVFNEQIRFPWQKHYAATHA